MFDEIEKYLIYNVLDSNTRNIKILNIAKVNNAIISADLNNSEFHIKSFLNKYSKINITNNNNLNIKNLELDRIIYYPRINSNFYLCDIDDNKIIKKQQESSIYLYKINNKFYIVSTFYYSIDLFLSIILFENISNIDETFFNRLYMEFNL